MRMTMMELRAKVEVMTKMSPTKKMSPMTQTTSTDTAA